MFQLVCTTGTKFQRLCLCFGVWQNTRLLHRLIDVWIYEESKMTHINFRLTDAIFISQQIHTSDNLRSSLIVKLDPINMGIADGILLLACIRLQIYVFSYQVPVNGRHL